MIDNTIFLILQFHLNFFIQLTYPHPTPTHTPSPNSHAEPQLFTLEQRQILLRFFDECGMNSTHRRNSEIIQRCADEVGTSIERVKVREGKRERERERERECVCVCVCV